MSELHNIIDDIKLLHDIKSLSIEDIDPVIASLKTIKNAHVYLNTIAMGGKPETALSDCLFKPLIENRDYLDLNINPQMKAGDGWVDFLIKEGVGNPVAIELKPLHEKRLNKIHYESLEPKFNSLKLNEKNQIVQYLRDYDYVLLSNMYDIYYFNREAIFDFKPFLIEKFLIFVDDLIINKDVWDVVRRKEDKTPKLDLGKRFFIDLKKWYSEFQNIEFIYPDTKQEKVVQLLNKFIFLKTLEDYGLIPFNFIRETYEDKFNRWSTKGRRKIFYEFFTELNNWSYEYYDTELFKEDLFLLINQEDNNLELLQRATEKVLGLSEWSKVFGIGLIHYNYRNIDEDIFGKAYETFLAEEKKQQGVFYTSSDITQYMSKIIVDELFLPLKNQLLSALDDNNFEAAQDVASKLIDIKIIDPACGSGSFLVKVLKYIWDVYAEIDKKTEWATMLSDAGLFEPKDIVERKESIKSIRQYLNIGREYFNGISTVSSIILRHIYGIDLDEKAIDVAKVNLWKEAVKLVPHSFRYKSLPSSLNHVLPNLGLNFVVANSIVDLPLNDLLEILSHDYKNEIIELHSLRNKYLNEQYNPEINEEAILIKLSIRETLINAYSDKLSSLNTVPTLLPLEFFFCYFNAEGNVMGLSESGFHAVIGNPPWENIKPIVKEFASYYPKIFGDISKFSITGKDFSKVFVNKLRENEDIMDKWQQYCNDIMQLSNHIRNNYELYGESGDLSYQKVFLEKAINLTKDKGVIAFLVPSGFHTDEGQKILRQEIFAKYTLSKLMSFENRGHKWFAEVDPRFKFDSIIIKKTRNDDGIPIDAKFYIHEICEVSNPISIPISYIELFSPSTLGFVEFRNNRDVDVATKIRGKHPLLGDLKYSLSTEFHMTNDSKHFQDYKSAKDFIILYEGKMFHQYDSEYDLPRYCIEESIGRDRLISKEIYRINRILKNNNLKKISKDDFNKNKFKLNYEDFRLAYRAVASSTNERTLISTILPPNVFTGHSINVFKSYEYEIINDEIIQKHLDYKEMLYYLALFNSFTLDYYMRLRVSANVTMFFIYELPIPDIDAELKMDIINMSLNLLPHFKTYIELSEIVGIKKKNLSPNEKRQLRVSLEKIIAKNVFNLNNDEIEYLLDTFIYGNIDKEFINEVKTSLS